MVPHFSVIDLPYLTQTADYPRLGGGLAVRNFLPETASPLALMTLDESAETVALGTRQGTVKRVRPEAVNKDSWHIIRLADDDAVIGAIQLSSGDDELVFVTSDAQLLRFSADLVRPQGREGQGIAGIKLAAGAHVLSFGSSRNVDEAYVATIAGTSEALTFDVGGSAKVTPLSAYPAKGRATGGVRCQRFLAGEDHLIGAWVGDGLPLGATDAGSPIDMPAPVTKRDASGVPTTTVIHGISSARVPNVLEQSVPE